MYRPAVGEDAAQEFYQQARRNALDEASNERYKRQGDEPGEATGGKFTQLSAESRQELNELLSSAEFCSRAAVLEAVQAKPQAEQVAFVMQTFREQCSRASAL